MSRVLLVDVDSKIPNLALMKLSAWHKAQGDQVSYLKPANFRGKRRVKIQFYQEHPDLVYISCIFKENSGFAQSVARIFPHAKVDIGGSGFDLERGLPGEIERIKPDYDLYPSEYSQGYTTRGCDRRCPFCIVYQKEGHLSVQQLPEEFHDDRFNTCMIMDNNLLQAPRYWVHKVLRWFNESGTNMLDHGFDARLLTEEYAGMLKDIKHPKGIRFAWDHRNDEPAVINAIKLLKDAGFNLKHDVSFYVLAGFAMVNGKPMQIPFSPDDLYRCYRLKEKGVNAFVMPYHKKDKGINALAKWANRRWAYWSGPFAYGDYEITTIKPNEVPS